MPGGLAHQAGNFRGIRLVGQECHGAHALFLKLTHQRLRLVGRADIADRNVGAVIGE
jgi:hypothetical protein